MRIAVVSDTHGIIEPFIESVKNIENVELIIHLGDMVHDAKEIRKMIDIPVKMVRGNNDYYDENTPWSELIRLNNYKFYLTHGHFEKVNFGVTTLLYKALEVEADMVLYGHTHKYFYDEIEGVKILNPGSAGFDRGHEYESYAIVDIDEEIKVQRIKLDIN